MKLNAEKLLKWGIAIVTIFGIIGALFRLELVTPLFIVLILTCCVLVLLILLQAGKGGGLAALGGLTDQTAFGTKTGTFLSKVTYLVGAAFIVTTICLTKITTTRHVITIPPAHEVPAPAHGFIPAGEEVPVSPPETEGPAGMKTVQESGGSATSDGKGAEVPKSTQKSEQQNIPEEKGEGNKK
ncbi:MAG: preprotein translocase subunit SecG [Planctomycetes bacterium]|nr:preprotein translocase subunit SecG [Planctomycetota bacterium]